MRVVHPICLLAASCVVLLATTAVASVRRVPTQFATIQAAVSASSTGDTVLVAPGTYSGPGNRDIDLRGKDITLRSEAGAASTALVAAGTELDPHRVVSYLGLSTATVLEGFTLTGGHAGTGGAVRAEGAATVRECVISGNDAVVGGGVALPLASSHLVIEDTSIEMNHASQGGGVAVERGTLVIRRSIIRGNDCSGDNPGFVRGGGVAVVPSSGAPLPQVTLEDCQITGNVANRGGGVMMRPSTVELTRCTIAANAARTQGGGLYNAGGSILATDCIVWDNGAVEGSFYYDDSGDSPAWTGFYCSIVDFDGMAGDWPAGLFTGTFDASPLFCAPTFWQDAPTIDGAFQVAENSPALPQNNGCGRQLGMHGQGCAALDVPPEAVDPSLPMVKIVANPALHGRLRLSVGSGIDAALDIEVYGTDGRRVWGAPVEPSSDRSIVLGPGVYFVRSALGTKRETQKVVVMP